jgi:hypothetical protein
MSTKITETIDTNNLSEAWAKVFLRLVRSSKQDLAPLSISIGCSDPGLSIEDPEIRGLLDHALADLSRPGRPLFGCRTTSNTIFPFQYWAQKGRPDCVTFGRLYMGEYLKSGLTWTSLLQLALSPQIDNVCQLVGDCYLAFTGDPRGRNHSLEAGFCLVSSSSPSQCLITRQIARPL